MIQENQRAAEGKVEDLQAQTAQLEQQLANAKVCSVVLWKIVTSAFVCLELFILYLIQAC